MRYSKIKAYIKIGSISLLILLTFSSMAQAAYANLIANPGFESGSPGPHNWQLLSNYGNTPVLDPGAHSGTRSVKIQITGTSNKVSGSAMSDTFSVQPLSNYTVSAYVKTLNTGGSNPPTVVVAELDIQKQLIQKTKLAFGKGTNPWMKKELTFKTRTSTRYVYVYAVIENGYGTFWLDDLSFSLSNQASTPTPTVPASPSPAPVPPLTQSPYSGTPRSIPGTIQAEDFDKGGEGIAYHDLDSVNQGGQYRSTEGADIELTLDTGTGYNVGWIQSGEWLEYTTTVSNAGTYTIETRVASNGNGGTFHIEFNGVDKTGPLTIPNTGGWQTWQSISKTVTLTQGQQVMKIVMDTNGATGSIGNINYVRVASSTPSPAPSPVPTPPQTQSPYGGSLRSIPGTIQAEDFDNGGEGIAYHDLNSANLGGKYRSTDGIDIESIGSGAGYNVGWMQSREWLEFTTTVSSAGSYLIELHVASGGNGGTFHIEFNGVDKTGPLTIPNTGGWQNWQLLSKTVTLNSGQQIMKIVMDTDGATGNVGNIDYVRITSSSASPPTTLPTPPPTTIDTNAYYVATNGNDANPGTEALPWKTIQKAANTLTAGKTVYVKSGTYNEQVTVKNSGSAGKYITFSAYPGNTVTIDGAGINMDFGYGRDGGLIQIWGKSYIKVVGFTAINSGYAGLYVNTPGNNDPPSHDIIFEGNTVKDSWAASIIMLNYAPSNAVNFVARNNIIIRGHMGGNPAAHETLSFGGRISNFEISGNTIKDSFWGAIDAKDGVSNGKIFGNVCTTTEYSCIYIDGYTIGADNIDVFNNVVHDMKNVGTDSSGFNVASEKGGPTTNIRFYNNLVYNNPGTAMRTAFYNSGTEGRVDGIIITSNTFYNNGIGNAYRGGISLERKDATNVVVRNNILYQNNAFGIKNLDADAIIDHNLETNPYFVNPTAANFHLQSNSPAINVGSSAPFIPFTDFEGKSRPSGGGYDIGAYEYT